jgi:hypothetical protein
MRRLRGSLFPSYLCIRMLSMSCTTGCGSEGPQGAGWKVVEGKYAGEAFIERPVVWTVSAAAESDNPAAVWRLITSLTLLINTRLRHSAYQKSHPFCTWYTRAGSGVSINQRGQLSFRTLGKPLILRGRLHRIQRFLLRRDTVRSMKVNLRPIPSYFRYYAKATLECE